MTDSRGELVHWLGLTDANSAGFVHGGTIMKLCDEAGALAAVKHSRCRVVTAGMDRMTFLERVEVGELLVLKASVNAVWRTSMEVGVRVTAERPATGESRHTNTAYLTFVALDEQGLPTQVPPLHIDEDDRDGRRREQDAQLRRRNRLAERDEIRAAREAGRPAEV